MEKFKWTGFGKFWLYLCLVANIFTLLSNLFALTLEVVNLPILLMMIVIGGIQITAIVLMLFRGKKLGFYLWLAAALLATCANAINGALISGLISAGLGSAILYLAIRSHWNDLD